MQGEAKKEWKVKRRESDKVKMWHAHSKHCAMHETIDFVVM